jgi:hypothetical protein
VGERDSREEVKGSSGGGMGFAKKEGERRGAVGVKEVEYWEILIFKQGVFKREEGGESGEKGEKGG